MLLFKIFSSYIDFIVELKMEYELGKNAEDNWRIVEVWFHLNSFPSSHLVIKDENPPTEHILNAANIVKNNSKYRHIKNIKVVYTHIKNLRLGEKVGLVEIISKRKCNFVIP